jgi:hypothetical protein
MNMKVGSPLFFLSTSFLFGSAIFAQSPESVLRAKACGAGTVQFAATSEGTEHPLAQPEAGKATVYVIGTFVGDSPAQPTVKIGLDGAWAGATRGNSYIYMIVAPGEHHLCANWQSGFLTPSNLFALGNFTAEAGKTYYFRARAFNGTKRGVYSIDLDAANDDEGQYLVAASAFSKSHPKK